MVKSLFFSFVFLFSSALYASDVIPDLDDLGDEKGNGGDGVVCYDENNKIKSVQLLDHYEAKALFGFDMDLGPSQDYKEKVKFVLKNVGKFDLPRSVQYQFIADKFEKEAVFLPGVVLEDIPDSQHLAVPKNCKIEQVVIQQEPTLPEQKRYTVSKDLWDLMDADSKAGLVLHEIIFNEAIQVGQKNSIRARYFNSVISQIGFKDQAGDYYLKRLTASGFKKADKNECVLYPGFQGLKVKNIHHRWDGHGVEGALCEAADWRLTNGRILHIPLSSNEKFPTRVGFYYSGELLTLWPEYNQFTVDLDLPFAGTKVVLVDAGTPSAEAIFFKNGTISHARIAKRTTLKQFDDCEMILPDSSVFQVEKEGGLDLSFFVFYQLCFPGPDGGKPHQIIGMGGLSPSEGNVHIAANGFVTFMESHLGNSPRLIAPVFKGVVELGSHAWFHSNGIISRGTLEKDYTLMTSLNEMKLFKEGTELRFNTEGKVVE